MRPVALLAPGRGKTKKAFVWVYRTTNFVTQRAVLYDFTLSRSGEHPRRVLGAFGGTLVTDDFSGYVAAEDMLPLSHSPPGSRPLLGN